MRNARFSRLPGRQVFLALLTCLALVGSGEANASRESGEAAPAELVALLQAGGLILYVRHAATDHSQADVDLSDLSRCELQRNLSGQGRAESQIMAAAIAHFDIPIGQVYSSPYCRTIDTAEIVFGRYKVLHDLRATFFTDKDETARINAFLRGLLTQTPAAATNTVIVGHTANLSDVTQVWPKPEGVAHVFRPLDDVRFEHLGKIAPNDWADLMSRQ